MTLLLNRSLAPATKQANLPQFEVRKPVLYKNVKNLQIPLEDDVARLDIVFKSGSIHQPFPSLLSMIEGLVFSGTENKTEKQILDTLDNTGAYYQCEYGLYETTFTLYSTPGLIEKAGEIFVDAILNASFPEDKLTLLKSRKIAALKSDFEKTTYLAKVKLNELFYKTPSLKEAASVANYKKIQRKDLIAFYRNSILSNVSIYCSGTYKNFNTAILQKFTAIKSNNAIETIPVLEESAKPHTHIHKAKAVQTTLRGKCVGIGRLNPDYPILQLANTIYGGFFGSLLMKNIREEKGLTYGIGSSLNAYTNHGTIGIQGDIKIDNIGLVLQEIATEMTAIKSGNFDLSILEKARNYLLGNIAKSFDDTFAITDKSKLVYLQGLPSNYHHTYFESIKSATLDEVSTVANKYLHFDKFVFVTCGPETK